MPWLGVSRSYRNNMIVEDSEAIKMSLFNLLTTPPRSRWFNPSFGNVAMDLLFEPLTGTFPRLAADKMKTYVTKNDPRISIERTEIDQDIDHLSIYLTFYYVWIDQEGNKRYDSLKMSMSK